MVAHYGSVAATRIAVTSLLEGEVRPDAVLVVDNGGDMPALDMDGVEVVRPGRNLGYAGACRLGAEHAASVGAEWAWLLNNDAVAERGCLAALVAAGEVEPRAALLSPLITRSDARGLWYAGGEVRPRSLTVAHATRVRADTPYETAFVTGCAWLARTAYVCECGPPDETLFMYFEDVDWTLRARAAGWKTIVVPKARVKHDVEVSRGRRRFSPTAAYYMTRNRLLLARRWGSLPDAVGAALYWGARQVLKCRSARVAAMFMVAMAVGLGHGLAGRYGVAPRALVRRLS